jgi:hypothetical protein
VSGFTFKDSRDFFSGLSEIRGDGDIGIGGMCGA